MKREDYPFDHFDAGKFEEDMDKVKWLEKHEMHAIENLLLSGRMEDMANRIGWRFLTMCVFGMRISDAMRLDEQFINDAGHLEFRPHKTRHSGNVAQMPIVNDKQRFYMEKTLSLPITGKDPKNFRTIFNEHLKVIAAKAGITTHVTSHVGRHTMGGFLVDADINEEVSKKMLGVKSNKTIKIYRHLKENKLLSEANKLKGIF